MEEMRIQKYLSDCGVMSRRSAEEAVKHGRVIINGERAVIGQKVVPDIDEVMFDGVIITNENNKKIYIMMYKPAGIVTTMSDERGRECIGNLLNDANIGTRIYPIGRLDMYSEGMLLLTNDGELSNKLMHPRHEITKVYQLTLKGEIPADRTNAITLPIEIDGRMSKPAKVSVIELKNDKTKLRVELSEGRNRQIRRICENLELIILKLKRVCVGDLNIGTLKPGEWRHLNYNEVKYLKGI